MPKCFRDAVTIVWVNLSTDLQLTTDLVDFRKVAVEDGQPRRKRLEETIRQCIFVILGAGIVDQKLSVRVSDYRDDLLGIHVLKKVNAVCDAGLGDSLLKQLPIPLSDECSVKPG